MLSFPFNSSTTVFHYNKDAFKAAGLDPRSRRPPGLRWPWRPAKTQDQRPQVPVHDQLGKLDAAGELLSLAQHRIRDQRQRLARHGCPPDFQQPLHVRHIENLANMAKRACSSTRARQRGRRHVRVGRMRHGDRLIGPVWQCQAQRQVRVGIGALPYYPDVKGAPQNTVIGGASLWVMSGKKEARLQGCGPVLCLPVQA
jgi:sn-glycerol 3-phosphate transport system substrate-binding protein